MAKTDLRDIACTEYHGTYGITQHCLKAIARLIHYGEIIEQAKLLTCRIGAHCEHALMLNLAVESTVIIKAGFTSGYGGEGPRGLSTALRLLMAHDVEMDEYRVSGEFMGRLNAGCLLNKDIEWLDNASPVRPVELYDYLHETQEKRFIELFPASINYGLVDERIYDLALNFHDNPDYAISTAFKRLEDIIRNRVRLPGENGVKLFKKAFLGEESLLEWQDENNAEHNSKADLFKDIFGAFRNPRAHREIRMNDKEAVREFMLVNELYCLESCAVERLSETG